MLAGVTGHRIGQWARYGLITPTGFKGSPANLYTFFDVAEAIAVRWLLEKGFDYGELHRAIDYARRSHPNWPLQRSRIGVAQHAVQGDPRGTIALEECDPSGTSWVDTLARGSQQILEPKLLERTTDMLRRGGWLAEQHSLKHIAVDPELMGGIPTIRGRRWSVGRVAQLAADPEGRRVLIEDYHFESEAVDDALRWSAEAQKLAG